MSRSGYAENFDDNWSYICYRGAVASAIRGARGQALLRETLEALDAMPVKELARYTFERDGQFCTLGVVGAKRGIRLTKFMEGDARDPEDIYVNHFGLAKALDVSEALVREVMYENDEDNWRGTETPAERWTRMRAWVNKQIVSQ